MSQHPNVTDSGSRRNFLKKGALAAAAIVSAPHVFRENLSAAEAGAGQTATAPSTGEVTGANERIRVGFIGVGNQGFGGHVRTVTNHGSDWNVQGVAVCDVWKNRAERARAHLGLSDSDAYEDYRYMLDRDDIDAVYIGAVDHWHSRIAIDAVEAGKHVYVEKPMTRYLGEAFKLHDAVKKSGRIFQLGTHHTSQGHWHKSRELVRAGKLGPLVLAQTSFCRNNPDGEWNYRIDEAATPDTLNWKMWLGPVSERPFDIDAYFRWRKYYPYCSGILGDLLSHKLHPLMIATDTHDFPVRVACMGTRKITTDRDVPDTTQFIGEYPSGLNFVIMGSTVNEEGLREVIRGHHATLSLGGSQVDLRPERPFSDEIDPETYRNLSGGNHQKNWFDCIRSGADPISNIDQAIRGQTVISMAEMSDRLGQMVYFDEESRQMVDSAGKALPVIDYDNPEPSEIATAASTERRGS